ncbi:MAG TPA: hypothetical protein VIO60_07695, partial [Rectinemataceae bacterium]
MRIFVPSWQKPGTWLENLEFISLESWVQGVELLFFSWDDRSKRDFFSEAERIASYSGRFDFSLHLPEGLPAGTEDLVRATHDFVELYVFHPGSGSAWNRNLDSCLDAAGESRFALEYTGAESSADFASCEASRPGISLCADTGRLMRDGIDPATWIEARAGRLAEIHLHSAAREGGSLVDAGPLRDHKHLSGMEAWLPWLVGEARLRGWILNLETFAIEESKASYAAL